MALGKHVRQDKKSSSFNVTIATVVFVALCLIAVWAFSSSSSPEGSNDVNSVSKIATTKKPIESDPFEDSSDNNEIKTEDEEQDPPVEKPSKKSKAEPESSVDSTEEIREVDSEKPKKKSKTPKKEEIKEENEVEEKEEASSTESKESNPPKKSKEGSNIDDISVGGAESEVLVENKEASAEWKTQASESGEEKEVINAEKSDDAGEEQPTSSSEESSEKEVIELNTEAEKPKGEQADSQYSWKLCDNKGGNDYIPCLDNEKALKMLHSTKHYEHRERHCPEQPPTCLVPLPDGYRSPIHWPQSRNEVWYKNVPHPGLASYKKDQNWVKKSGERLIFPGGGTQFKHGVKHYIDYIEQVFPAIGWGKRTRVVLDVGCGVASFGGYLFDKDVHTISFAPKDEHEAQVQLALERGIPAISSVMGTQRLVFPSDVFDIVHCARCRVPWHIEGGKLLLELNRVLRPGGYFVWSATPVYWTGEEDVAIWKDMVALTASMCWKMVGKSIDSTTGIGVAFFQKPKSNSCYEGRQENEPPICDEDDKPDAAWYVPMTTCMHKIPSVKSAHGKQWPSEWPERLQTAPAWLSHSKGLYGQEGASDFQSDMEHWQRVVSKSYNNGLGINWENIRNVMDMRAVYGGFAAALASKSVWVMNVVPVDGPDTLPIIFDRGLVGIYHDWCESFSTYPRTYDLLHADHLFSKLQKRCDIAPTVVEMDRILRPDGWAIFRDKSDVTSKIEALLKSLHWEIRSTYYENKESIVVAQKKFWRPENSS